MSTMRKVPGELHINDYAVIEDHSEWHGNIGIVEDVINNVPILYCVNKSYHRYQVTQEVKDHVNKVIFN